MVEKPTAILLCRDFMLQWTPEFVFSGTRASIDAIEAASRHKQFASIKAQRLKTTHAFHSRLMENILPAFAEMAKSIKFKEPLIPVETCSKGSNWTQIDANKIVQHSRKPVYFADAVGRISERLRSCLWVEAGSESSIMAMVRRALIADIGAKHILQPINISGINAQTSLARAFRDIWAAGSKTQFWPFHNSQKDTYAWINLPPYHFEKARHLIPLKASVERGCKTETAPKNPNPELLRKLEENDTEALFSIDRAHSIFDLCTRGHSVLSYSLCPASMYLELVIQAARAVAGQGSSKTIPKIQGLEISSSLSVQPGEKLFLRLKKGATTNRQWLFTIFSLEHADTASTKTHANGYIALLARDTHRSTSEFQSFNRLIGPLRCEQIFNAPLTNGLKGPVIYKDFGRVVDYASFYRGVSRIAAKDGEAVGYVSVPVNQPPELNLCCSNPVAIDNFLQVAGIHINCLRDSKHDEVFVCTAIREISFSDKFINEANASNISWTVYSNFGRNSEGHVVNDIFVLDTYSKDLVLILMGAQFTCLPTKSLSRALSKLDISYHSGSPNSPHQDDMSFVDDPTRRHFSHEFQNHQHGCSENEDIPSDSESESNRNQTTDKVLNKLQKMMSEVLDIPTDDVQPKSALNDLGIDSLMVTEVISEIKSRFGVTISNSEFQELADVQSLCGRLQPSALTESSGDSQRRGESTSIRKPNAIQNTGADSTTSSIERSQLGLGPNGRNCFMNTKHTFDLAANESRFIGFSHGIAPLQSKLVLAYVVEAFEAMNCSLNSITPGQRLPDIAYSFKHHKLVKQLYNILVDALLVTQITHGVCRTGVEVPQTSSQRLYAEIIDKFPQHAAEHKLLHTTGAKLAQCLIEREDPTTLLFGNATARALMTEVYTNAPMFKTGTIVLAWYLVDIFNKVDPDHEIRVLELGAGTGGTTSHVLEELTRCGRIFQYTFTDLSSSLVTAAK